MRSSWQYWVVLGMELTDRSIEFISSDGDTAVEITCSKLEKYPKSFLTVIASSGMTECLNISTVITTFDLDTLWLIAYFYENDAWLAPEIKGNQLVIPEVDSDDEHLFVHQCQFLGLPDSPIYYPDEESSENNDDYGDDCDDDFYPYEEKDDTLSPEEKAFWNDYETCY